MKSGDLLSRGDPLVRDKSQEGATGLNVKRPGFIVLNEKEYERKLN